MAHPADSGVETNFGTTDGLWSAFMKAQDPAVYQLTSHVILPDEVFTLKVDAHITWAATAMTMVLYYEDTGMQIPMATQEVTLTGNMATYSVDCVANDFPEAIGSRIGIQFSNTSPTASSWIGFDNVRLLVK